MTFKKYEIVIVVFFSFCLAIGLGLLDRETESLWHLFTAEPGNLMMMLIFLYSFPALASAGCGLLKVVKRQVEPLFSCKQAVECKTSRPPI